MATTKQFRVKHGLDASNNLVSYVSTPVADTDAATKGYVDLLVANTGGGVGGGASVTVSNTSPSTASEGDLWYDTETADLFVYTGSSFLQVTGTGGGSFPGAHAASVSTSNTAPISAEEGDIWYDPTEGVLNVYYNEFWVEAITFNELLHYVTNTDFQAVVSNTNSWITSIENAQSQYLQVANVTQYINSNTSTSSASLSGNTVTFTRADSSTYTLDLSGLSTESGNGSGASVSTGNTAPISPTEGDLWFDTDTGILNVYYDGFWVETFYDHEEQPHVATQENPPTNPSDGDMWFDVSEGVLNIYYDGFWVEAISSTTGTSSGGGGGLDTFIANGQYLVANSILRLVKNDSTEIDIDFSEFATNTQLQSVLSNTNIAISDRMQVANVHTYVSTAIGNLVNSAPQTLNTLNELAEALGNDENFSVTLTNNLATKASNTFVTSTYVTNTVFQTETLDRMQVANVIAYVADVAANTSTANGTLANNVITFYRQDGSPYIVDLNDLDTGETIPQGTTPLQNPEPGNLWFDTELLILYIYYDGYWVPVTPSAANDLAIDIANTSTSSASLSNNIATFTRQDGSSFDLDLSGIVVANTATANATLSNNIITFNRADSSTFTVDLNTLDTGETIPSSATPPSSPEAGNLWFDTEELKLYIYYDNYWIPTVSLSVNQATSNAVGEIVNQYLQVANAGFYSTSNANFYSGNSTIVFTRGDASSFDVNLATFVTANTSTANAVLSGNTVTFTRADSSTFDLDLSAFSGGGGGASVNVGNTAPTEATQGDMYFDEDYATLYVYYANTWVEVLPNNIADNPIEITVDSYTANGSTTTFAYTSDISSAKDLIVTVDGLVQRPTDDYTVNGSNVVFTEAISDTSVVAVRSLNGTGAGTGGGGISYAEATANTDATAGYKYIVDSTSVAVTIVLPATAELGDEVGVIDGVGNASVNNITVDRNGHNIQGAAENLTIDVDRAAFTLVYYNTTQGWLLTEV